MLLQSNKKVDNAANKSTSGYTLLKSDITLDRAMKLPTYWPALLEAIKNIPIEIVRDEKRFEITKEIEKNDENVHKLITKLKAYVHIMLTHQLASRAQSPHDILPVILNK